jgi:hypothetical protein
MRKLLIAAGILVALTLGAKPAIASHSGHRASHMAATTKVSSKHAKKHSGHKHHKLSKSHKSSGK